MRLICWIIATLGLWASACLSLPEDNVVEPDPAQERVDDIDQLVAPEGFMFETSYTQPLTLKVLDEAGAPMQRILFMVYSAPPEAGGTLLARGLTNAVGEFYTELAVTTSQQALYAYTPYGDLVRSQRIELAEGSPIAHLWGSGPEAEVEAAYKNIRTDGSFDCRSELFQVVDGTLKKLDIISGTYTTIGPASGEYNGIGFNQEDNFVYGIDRNDLHLWRIDNTGRDTDLGRIPGLHTDFRYRADFDTLGNLVAIAPRNGTWKLAIIDVDQSPVQMTEVALTSLGNVPLTSVADLVYSPIFKKFYGLNHDAALLEVDYWARTIKKIADYSNLFPERFGPFGAGWTSADGHLYWSSNSTGKIYKIEMDQAGHPAPIEFLMQGEVTNKNDGCSCASAQSSFDDADGDGIPNGSDDFPDDSEVAFATYTPSQYGLGTYAFEDFWPRKGDFDLNDAVLKYHYTVAKDNQNLIRWMTLNLRIAALGAGFQSGFGIQFDGLAPGDIASVSGPVAPSISTNPNGTEAGQSQAVVVLYDNGHTLMGARVGQLINTGDPEGIVLPPHEIEVRIEFSRPLQSIGEINPFLIARGDRGYEIHLKGFAPTDLADMTLFNTEDDASIGSDTYQTANGLPWGIKFSQPFRFPKERANLLRAYPQFQTWVTSAGAQHADWYLQGNASVAELVER